MVLKACCLVLLLVLEANAEVPRPRVYTATPEGVTSDPSGIEDDGATEYSVAALEEFLKNYEVERPRNRYFSNNRWEQPQGQKHSHPYDDRKGWVSLEPVPWSVSKISKWHSRYKPQESANFNSKKPFKQRPPPSTYHYQQNYHDPALDEDTVGVDSEDNFYNRPKPKPVISSFSQKLHIKNTISDPDYSSDIITDGMPANFPDHQYEPSYNRRQSVTTESPLPPATHPFSGDVLPPLKGSKVNMTTSHGGLLQVDSSFQTVEQAAQKVKRQKQKPKPRASTTTTTRRPKPAPVKRKEATETRVTTRNNAPDTSAVLAAVGAGMIPATMAMLLPMAMGGRKRRQARSVTGRPEVVEITLPRSL